MRKTDDCTWVVTISIVTDCIIKTFYGLNPFLSDLLWWITQNIIGSSQCLIVLLSSLLWQKLGPIGNYQSLLSFYNGLLCYLIVLIFHYIPCYAIIVISYVFTLPYLVTMVHTHMITLSTFAYPAFSGSSCWLMSSVSTISS